MELHSIIEQLRATGSSKAKLEILSANKNNRDLIKVIVATYDPKVNYYQRKIPAYNKVKQLALTEEQQFVYMMAAINDLANRTHTGNSAIDYLVSIFEELDESNAELLKCIIRRDLRIGCNVSTFNKVWAHLIPEVPQMLCEPYKDKFASKLDWSKGVMSQIKYDAARCFAVCDLDNSTVTYMTRAGSIIDIQNTPFIKDTLAIAYRVREHYLSLVPDSISDPKYDVIYLDGELQPTDDAGVLLPRKSGNGIITKIQRGTASPEELENIRYTLWDALPWVYAQVGKYEVEYQGRLSTLTFNDALAESNYFELTDFRMVYSEQEAREHFEYVNQVLKLEGTILKDPNEFWYDKRVQFQLKLKAEKDCDLLIIGFNPGKPGTKWENSVGSIRCISGDESVLVDVTGMSDDFRAYINECREEVLGKILHVVYNERISKKKAGTPDSLFLPRIGPDGIRGDKSVADLSEQIK